MSKSLTPDCRSKKTEGQLFSLLKITREDEKHTCIIQRGLHEWQGKKASEEKFPHMHKKQKDTMYEEYITTVVFGNICQPRIHKLGNSPVTGTGTVISGNQFEVLNIEGKFQPSKMVILFPNL